MTTQGISTVASKAPEQMAAKKTKANESSFDSFMADRASKTGTSQQKNSQPEKSDRSDKALDTGTSERADQALPLKKDTSTPAKNPETSAPQMTGNQTGKVVEENVDPVVVADQIVYMFQEVFGISMEFLQDFMSLNQMTLGETIESLGDGGNYPDNLQELVMNMHGITDKAAFLTNDTLVRELTELNDNFVRILADALQVPEEQLAEMDPSIMASLAEKLGDQIQIQIQAEPEIQTAQQDNQQPMPEMAADAGQGFEVIVEDARGSDTGAQTESFGEHQDAEPDFHNNTAATMANQFTERLAEAYETTADSEIPAARETMTHIVEQVVEQVKIRVLPETTNMEIMLHPESLGRVAIQVSAVAGVAKATLLVENLMAKEALESQLVTLKQTFEEQGLKVDAVEVTVSEFGLNQENHEAQQQQKNVAKNRKFRGDAGEDTEEDTETAEVQAERRNVNSVVDYTA